MKSYRVYQASLGNATTHTAKPTVYIILSAVYNKVLCCSQYQPMGTEDLNILTNQSSVLKYIDYSEVSIKTGDFLCFMLSPQN